MPFLKEKDVDRVFAEAKTQEDYIFGLHRLVIPNWDDVEQLEGFVYINGKTSKELFERCMQWDKMHEIKTMHGGAWFNWGFSGGGLELADWEYEIPKVRMKEAVTI